jgi:hypothetical protein
MEDTVYGGERGADTVKFESIGDYQYLVSVTMFKQR